MEPPTAAPNPEGRSFKSIFRNPDAGALAPKTPPQFQAPELMSGMPSMLEGDDAGEMELSSVSAWDVATRYHEFKARASYQKAIPRLRRISAQAVLDRAQEVLGSVVHPTEVGSAPLDEVPPEAAQVDFDLDATVDETPFALASAGGQLKIDFPIGPQDLWMSYSRHRKQPVVLSVDTSLSMTGEKLALTAVALAVVLLQFPDDPVGIVAFENEAKVLKRPSERISLQQLVERFLDVPAQGYTHLEDGMKAALKLVRASESAGQGRLPSAVLLTDGKYTAGRDPSYLAARFPHLVVLKMGREKASLGLCREMAREGHGLLREVGDLDALPQVMYGVVKDLLRGRSPT